MVTPRFEVKHDPLTVTVHVHVPEAKTMAAEFEARDDVFTYSLPPYYLRLRFDTPLVEDDRMGVRYDADTETVICRVAKKNLSEQPPSYSLLPQPPAFKEETPTSSPESGIVESEHATATSKYNLSERAAHAETVYVFYAAVDDTQRESIEIHRVAPYYGFNDLYEGPLDTRTEKENNINELKHGSLSDWSRKEAEARVARQFSPDKYLVDRFDNPLVEKALAWKPPAPSGPDQDGQKLLAALRRNKWTTNSPPRYPRQIYLGLLQLLFARAYDLRINLGKFTKTSAWTIGKIAPMIAALYVEFDSVKDVMIACTRRALTFPTVRSWELALAAWHDVVATLEAAAVPDASGTSVVGAITTLLDVFQARSSRVYQKIWIKDYALWAPHASDVALTAMRRDLEHQLARFNKEDVRLELEFLDGPPKDVAVKAVSTPLP